MVFKFRLILLLLAFSANCSLGAVGECTAVFNPLDSRIAMKHEKAIRIYLDGLKFHGAHEVRRDKHRVIERFNEIRPLSDYENIDLIRGALGRLRYGANILEPGAGVGNAARELAQNGFHVVANSFDTEAPERNDNLVWFNGLFENLTVGELNRKFGFFDLAFSYFGVPDYTAYLDDFIKTVSQCLKPGAKLVMYGMRTRIPSEKMREAVDLDDLSFVRHLVRADDQFHVIIRKDGSLSDIRSWLASIPGIHVDDTAKDFETSLSFDSSFDPARVPKLLLVATDHWNTLPYPRLFMEVD